MVNLPAAWCWFGAGPAPVPGRYYIRRPGSRAVMRCHPEGTPGIDRDATVVVNDLGLRGRMPTEADKLKILAIGGSTVEDALLNDGETWCDQLEQHLGSGAWVGNMGRSGTTARHHAVQIERTLPYLPKPDVILVLCGLNDMLADLGLHGVEREPSAAGCFGHGPGVETPQLPPGSYNVGEAFARMKQRRSQVKPEHFEHRSPAVADLDRYRSSLGALVAPALLADAKLVFITQPAIWRFGMNEHDQGWLYAGGTGSPDRWLDDPDTPWLSPLSLAMALSAYNRVMREFRVTSHTLDLAEQLPRETENFYDDFHFSRSGAERVGEIVARGLKEAGIG